MVCHEGIEIVTTTRYLSNTKSKLRTTDSYLNSVFVQVFLVAQ